MMIEEVKAELAKQDAEILKLRLARDNAESDLQVAALKRRNFARINCPHPKEQRYERSIMGREIDIECGVCGITIV
jgi:hypothetical protein